MKRKIRILPFLDSPSLRVGRAFASRQALSRVSHASLMLALKRHERGDWGEVDPLVWKANDEALWRGSEVVSTYEDERRTRFRVITEPDRSRTRILLDGEGDH